MDFQKYNIKEKKQKEKGKKKRKKKPQELLKNSKNNHIETIYGVSLNKIESFFFKVIVGYRNKN